jgi:hypothetical protein
MKKPSPHRLPFRPPATRFRALAGPLGTPAKCAPVAQLDRASDYESEGRTFESFRARQFFSIRINSLLRGPRGLTVLKCGLGRFLGRLSWEKRRVWPSLGDILPALRSIWPPHARCRTRSPPCSLSWSGPHRPKTVLKSTEERRCPTHHRAPTLSGTDDDSQRDLSRIANTLLLGKRRVACGAEWLAQAAEVAGAWQGSAVIGLPPITALYTSMKRRGKS